MKMATDTQRGVMKSGPIWGKGKFVYRNEQLRGPCVSVAGGKWSCKEGPFQRQILFLEAN